MPMRLQTPPVTEEEREEMASYLIDEGFYTAREVAAMTDGRIRRECLMMREEVSELDGVSGYEQTR